MNRLFTKEGWIAALTALGETFDLFVPVRDGDFHNFRSIDEGKRPDFSYQNTRLSPKFLVYPQSERMFQYSLDENGPEAHTLREAPKDHLPRAIIGIRPCDAHAFQLVEVNFDNPRYKDPWWVRRFESTTLVGLGCNKPCSTCFCTSVGGGPFNEKALDVLLFDLGDTYLAKPLTQKGEELLKQAGGGSPGDSVVVQGAEKLATDVTKNMPDSVPVGRLKEKMVLGLFEASFWEGLAFACINCGICTYLCPTCWCFDIQDEVLGKRGDRIRNWDSCMFPLFTLHGSGHNPRDKKVQRVRQRFMHKLKYYVDKYENGVKCSGCGRCVQRCPVNIDIRQVIEIMNNH